VFNPNIWTNDQQVATAALRAEDAPRANAHVGALLEEVAALPGIPEKHVTSTEQRWIDFAVSQGLVERRSFRPRMTARKVSCSARTSGATRSAPRAPTRQVTSGSWSAA